MEDPYNVLMTQENLDGISVMFPAKYRPYRDIFVDAGVQCARKHNCKTVKVLLKEGKKLVCIPMKEVDLFAEDEE